MKSNVRAIQLKNLNSRRTNKFCRQKKILQGYNTNICGKNPIVKLQSRIAPELSGIKSDFNSLSLQR